MFHSLQVLYHHVHNPHCFAPASLLSFSSGHFQLTRAISTGGLLQRIDVYKSSLECLVGGNAVTVALVEERFGKIEETIRKEFC